LAFRESFTRRAAATIHHVETSSSDGALPVLDAAFQVAAAYAISCIPSLACYDRKSLLNPRFFCVS
jgi:hypothetical protein